MAITKRTTSSLTSNDAPERQRQAASSKKFLETSCGAFLGTGSMMMLSSFIILDKEEPVLICLFMGTAFLICGGVTYLVSTSYPQQFYSTSLPSKSREPTPVVTPSHEEKKQTIPSAFSKARWHQAQRQHKATLQQPKPKSWRTKVREIIGALATYPSRIFAKYRSASQPIVSQAKGKEADEIKPGKRQNQKAVSDAALTHQPIQPAHSQKKSKRLQGERKKNKKILPANPNSSSAVINASLEKNDDQSCADLPTPEVQELPAAEPASATLPDIPAGSSAASSLVTAANPSPDASQSAALPEPVQESQHASLPKEAKNEIPQPVKAKTTVAVSITTISSNPSSVSSAIQIQQSLQSSPSPQGEEKINRRSRRKKKPMTTPTSVASPLDNAPSIDPLAQKGWVRVLELTHEKKLLEEKNRKLEQQVITEQHRTHYYFNLASQLTAGICYPYYYFFYPSPDSSVVSSPVESSPPVMSRREYRAK